MFTFCANKVNLKKLTGEVLTAGAAGIYTCQFDLSADWSGLAVKAVFRAGGTEKQVDVADGSCQIPWEVLREEGDILSVGLYGENQEQEVVLPTIWADLGRIMPAANLEGVTLPPTPSIAEQALEEIRKSEANAAAYAEEAKRHAGNAAWIETEVDENGHLIVHQSDNYFGAIFNIDETGNLEVTYT